MTPRLEFVFSAEVELGAPQEVGHIQSGVDRRVIPITGGRFQGPALEGRVLAGGADWQVVLPDGTAELDARYTLETKTGSLICVYNRGLRTGPPEVLARLRAGVAVDASSYYFRATPRFETADPKLRWLERSIFVASGERLASRVKLDFWRVG
ncbi:MAG: DUF3237 domain-containing protein [Bryobacteraceae bacterium]